MKKEPTPKIYKSDDVSGTLFAELLGKRVSKGEWLGVVVGVLFWDCLHLHIQFDAKGSAIYTENELEFIN